MTTPTRLGNALSTNKPAPSPAASAFQAALAGSRVCEPYELQLPNGTKLKVAITLVGSELLLDVEGNLRKEMESRGLPNDHTTQGNFELGRAMRILMYAVREWDEKKGADAPQLGTLAQWGELPPETIAACYERFLELREANDPLADDVRLDDQALLEVREAIAKKNTRLLRAYGLNRLIAYLRTTADQPAPSQTPKSEPGDSQPAS